MIPGFRWANSDVLTNGLGLVLKSTVECFFLSTSPSFLRKEIFFPFCSSLLCPPNVVASNASLRIQSSKRWLVQRGATWFGIGPWLGECQMRWFQSGIRLGHYGPNQNSGALLIFSTYLLNLLRVVVSPMCLFLQFYIPPKWGLTSLPSTIFKVELSPTLWMCSAITFSNYYPPRSLTARPWKVTFPIGKFSTTFSCYVNLRGCKLWTSFPEETEAPQPRPESSVRLVCLDLIGCFTKRCGI